MSQSTTPGIVNIKLAAYLALTSSTLSGRARVRQKQLLKIDNNGMLIAVTDWLWNETYYLITDVTGPRAMTGTPAAGDNALVVVDKHLGTQAVSGSVTASGTVTANQGTPAAQANRWPFFLSDGTNQALVINRPGATEYGLLIHPDASDTFPVSGNLAVTNNISAANMLVQQNPLTASDVPNVTEAKLLIDAAVKALNTYSNQFTTNATTTITSSTAYISAIAVNTDTIGTTSTVTIQDRQAMPLKLINGLGTAALAATPTILFPTSPIKMTTGIDVVTAGAVAAKVDVWIDYWQ